MADNYKESSSKNENLEIKLCAEMKTTLNKYENEPENEPENALQMVNRKSRKKKKKENFHIV